MAIYVSKTGDIHLFKGDSGNISFKGLPTDKNYNVYFAVSNPDTSGIMAEINTVSNFSDTVEIGISSEFTDKLPVEADEERATYQYGLKICHGDDEYTLIPQVEVGGDNPIFKPAPKVYVHQKYVEGTVL